MFLFVLLSFAITYYLAFPDIFDMRDLGHSFIYVVSMIFGVFDFPPLENSNRFFGPVLWLFFVLFVTLIFMNMFIAVISEIYVRVYNDHSDFWERHMTELLVLHYKLEQRKEVSSWDLVAMALERLRKRIVKYLPVLKRKSRRGLAEDVEISLDQFSFIPEEVKGPSKPGIFILEDSSLLNEELEETQFSSQYTEPTEDAEISDLIWSFYSRKGEEFQRNLFSFGRA